MKVSTKRCIIYPLIFSGLLASCEEEKMADDKEAMDEKPPELSIASPDESAKVWLTTPLKAEASDNQGVTKVVFYLDEKMLGEDTEAPYTLDLDTRQHEDGSYVLKAKAFDEAGNQQEIVQTIEILNKLVQVNVGENRLDNDWAPEEGWVVVTDTDGNAIDYKPLANGQSVTINRPEGMEDDKINVIIIENVFFGEGNKALVIDQYDDVSPLVWNMPDRNTTKAIGTATVSYVIPAGHEKYLESVWDGKGTYGNTQYQSNIENDIKKTYSLEIKQEPAGMLMLIHDVDENELPRFAFLNDIKVNDSYDLGSEDFQEMELWQTTTVPENDFMRLNVYGRSNNNQYKIYSDLGSFVSENVPAYVSESTFTDFSFDLSLSLNNKSYSIFFKGKPQSQYRFPDQELEIIEKTSNHFSAIVSSKNSVTYGMVQYGSWYDVNDYQHITAWNIYADLNDTLNTKQVDLPVEIKNKYPELEEHRPEYSSTELNTYKSILSLQDYLEWFNRPNKENAEYEQMRFFFGYNNGRVVGQPHHEGQSTDGRLPNDSMPQSVLQTLSQ